MLPIKSGRLKKPIKAVFYGLEGTGKNHPRRTDP